MLATINMHIAESCNLFVKVLAFEAGTVEAFCWPLGEDTYTSSSQEREDGLALWPSHHMIMVTNVIKLGCRCDIAVKYLRIPGFP